MSYSCYQEYVPVSGCDKTPVSSPRASEFLCGAGRSPWQLPRQANKVEPEAHLVTSHYNISSLSEGDCHLSITVMETRRTEERNPGK